MAVTIHLIGIPLVLILGLIIGGFVGFLLGLRAGAKRYGKQQEAEGPSKN
jgi:hypothetical protein